MRKPKTKRSAYADSPMFEQLLTELDRAITDLVKSTAEDYFAARERLLPNPFKELE